MSIGGRVGRNALDVPYSIEAMRIPAKEAFSSKYTAREILGALGLSDQGWFWAATMVQALAREERPLRAQDQSKGGSFEARERSGG